MSESKPEKMNEERIAVAMSGGVDSSVAALILHRQGEALVGISLQLHDASGGESGRSGRCCSPRDFLDARLVAERVGFPFYVLNLEREFRRSVIDDFVREYREGRTPLPCAHCNSQVKFRDLMARAATLGCRRLATGHYARLAYDPATSRTRLLRARDREKDQSYFLFGLTPFQRDHALFPVGDLTKDAVRELARGAHLGVADKPESMDLCFLPEGDPGGFLDRELAGEGPGVGDIVDGSGRVLGKHRGIHRYTVGQRRGLGIAGSDALYVLEIQAEDRRIVVGPKADQLRGSCHVPAPNWIGMEAPTKPVEAAIQIRHRHPPAEGTLHPDARGGIAVRFRESQRAIAPGQAAVFYRDDQVLGGGFIQSSH
ncbi:MAG: tRNA 2-thiouridine(34) synthase MnmA [Acidobacteria bacterium]|nr:tRNA 2-thiouridine(34) synthase MnmA [Acidobacteriota bacterium]